MRISLVVHVCGLFVRGFGLMFIAPAAVALMYGEYQDATGFTMTGIVTAAVGHLMWRAGGRPAEIAVEDMRRVVTRISATAAALGNVGPGFNLVGPMANFADLHPLSRITLTLAMWIGRLEVITVLVLLRPESWRLGQWSAARTLRPA